MKQYIKALTVHQPWAWAIIEGIKRIENRSRRTHYQGPLLIHAGQSKRSLGSILPNGSVAPGEHELAYGAIIGVVELMGCYHPTHFPDDPFAKGPWCWQLGEASAFDKPIIWTGKQGLFHVPCDAIGEQLAHV